MKRNVIKIDEEKCNGCGLCVSGCPEGAIQLIDGKARLVAENYCDGLGACIGECPQGAITTEQREAAAYDERATLVNIIPKGTNTIKAHLRHLFTHGETGFLNEALEELKARNIKIPDYKYTEEPHACSFFAAPEETAPSGGSVVFSNPVEDVKLTNWPVQLKLCGIQAQYFQNADLVFAADCTAFAYSRIHSEYLKNRVTIIFCPKLDHSNEEYIEKISQILIHNRIRSIEVLRMEVPCCGGTSYVVKEAINRSGKVHNFRETVIHIDGSVIGN